MLVRAEHLVLVAHLMVAVRVGCGWAPSVFLRRRLASFSFASSPSPSSFPIALIITPLTCTSIAITYLVEFCFQEAARKRFADLSERKTPILCNSRHNAANNRVILTLKTQASSRRCALRRASRRWRRLCRSGHRVSS